MDRAFHLPEKPLERFERDERETLQPPVRRPYLYLSAKPQPAGKPKVPVSVEVEQRPLSVYAEAIR